MQLELQIACAAGDQIPQSEQIESWVMAALGKISHSGGELTIRIVDEPGMIDLNHRYRGKNSATNILSFPFETAADLPLNILGDLVICAPVVTAEAGAQDKPLMNHWAHLVIHGILHLCGFNHQQEQEAERMELLEQGIMKDLRMADPYAPVRQQEVL